MRPEGPKYHGYYALSGLQRLLILLPMGDALRFRFALAPGFHIARRWRFSTLDTKPNPQSSSERDVDVDAFDCLRRDQFVGDDGDGCGWVGGIGIDRD